MQVVRKQRCSTVEVVHDFIGQVHCYELLDIKAQLRDAQSTTFATRRQSSQVANAGRLLLAQAWASLKTAGMPFMIPAKPD